MPIYEYKCDQCDHCFEKLMLSEDEKHVACPECKSKKTRKLMSCASFMGSGGSHMCSDSSPGGFS